jgi:hypothetical protein
VSFLPHSQRISRGCPASPNGGSILDKLLGG